VRLPTCGANVEVTDGRVNRAGGGRSEGRPSTTGRVKIAEMPPAGPKTEHSKNKKKKCFSLAEGKGCPENRMASSARWPRPPP